MNGGISVMAINFGLGKLSRLEQFMVGLILQITNLKCKKHIHVTILIINSAIQFSEKIEGGKRRECRS